MSLIQKFGYRALDEASRPVSGVIEAISRDVAVRELQLKFPMVLHVGDVQENKAKSVFASRVSSQNVQDFAVETSALLDAKVPLEETLKTQADLCKNQAFAEILKMIWLDVNSGKSLADAMAKHPKVFEKFFVSMVRGGEASGSLELIFRRAAELMETRSKIKSEIVGALTYPVLLFVVGTGAVVYLMMRVIPKFAVLFSSQGRLLPTSTKFMLATSDFLVQNWWIIVVILGAIYAGLRYMQSRPEGRLFLGHAVLKTPILGTLIAETETSRFCRMLSALLAGRVPILTAVSITAETINNTALQRVVYQLRPAIESGKPMGPVLQAAKNVFPELASRLIILGENSGELETMLEKVASQYEQKLSVSTSRLVRILEPLFLVIMGFVVGAIVVSMMSAIMAMNAG